MSERPIAPFVMSLSSPTPVFVQRLSEDAALHTRSFPHDGQLPPYATQVSPLGAMQNAILPDSPHNFSTHAAGPFNDAGVSNSGRGQLREMSEPYKAFQMGVCNQRPVQAGAGQDLHSPDASYLFQGEKSTPQRDPKLQRYATNPTPQTRAIQPVNSPLARNTTTYKPSSRISNGVGLTNRQKRASSKAKPGCGSDKRPNESTVAIPEQKWPEASGVDVNVFTQKVSTAFDPVQGSTAVLPKGPVLFADGTFKTPDAASDIPTPTPVSLLRRAVSKQACAENGSRRNRGLSHLGFSKELTVTYPSKPVADSGKKTSGVEGDDVVMSVDTKKASPQGRAQGSHTGTSQIAPHSSATARAKSPVQQIPVGGHSQRHHRRKQGTVQQSTSIPHDSSPSVHRPPGSTHRAPRRRAVVVGVNYVFAPNIRLHGCCNDATLMGLLLINLCDFQPHDVLLLIDTFPSACYRSPHFEEREDEGPDEVVLWKDRQPTRRNILLALNWLRSDTQPGDVLFFFFAGHGVQLDDMSGWEGEGYDEAILPMDFFGDEVNALTAIMIKNLLLSVSDDVQLTMVIDCVGGQTMLDPAGTGTWKFIKGIKQKGVWPLVTDATDKVARAVYDPTTWTSDGMRRRGARPRFVPGVDVSSTQELLDPTLQRPTNPRSMNVKGFLFAAAPWGQTAIEVKMSAVALRPVTRRGDILRDRPVTMMQGKRFAYHGAFSWCFLTALRDLIVKAAPKRAKAITYQRLFWEIEMKMKHCKSKEGGLLKLDQTPELTFYRSGNSDVNDLFLWPFGGKRRGVPFSTEGGFASMLPCVPHETRYLSPWEAEEELTLMAQRKRERDPALRAQVRRCQESGGNPWRCRQQKKVDQNSLMMPENGLVFGSKHQLLQRDPSFQPGDSLGLQKNTHFLHRSLPVEFSANEGVLTPKQTPLIPGTEKPMFSLIPQPTN